MVIGVNSCHVVIAEYQVVVRGKYLLVGITAVGYVTVTFVGVVPKNRGCGVPGLLIV